MSLATFNKTLPTGLCPISVLDTVFYVLTFSTVAWCNTASVVAPNK